MRSLNIWQPQKAFFCFKITTGGLIIGWFNLIGSIISSLSLLIAAYIRRDHLANQPGVFVHMALASVSISFVMSVLSFISSLLLLIGVSEGRPSFMMPFLVLRVISAVISSLSGVCLFIYWITMFSTLGGFIVLNLFTILTMLIVYEILIVRVCRIKAQEEGTQCKYTTDEQNAYLILQQERNLN